MKQQSIKFNEALNALSEIFELDYTIDDKAIKVKKRMKRAYTVEELRVLASKLGLSKDDSMPDDWYLTDRKAFQSETNGLFDWIEKMESKGQIDNLLKPRDFIFEQGERINTK